MILRVGSTGLKSHPRLTSQALAGDTTPPVCVACGDRLGMYEPVSLQYPGGIFTSTPLLNLDHELRSGLHQTLFHLGCLAPAEMPESKPASWLTRRPRGEVVTLDVVRIVVPLRRDGAGPRRDLSLRI